MADEDMIDVATPASGSMSDDSESEGEPVELLVKGRERRKTAGNRYDRQMVQEEVEEADEEDEVALLFAGEQDEVDEEFRSEASDEDDMSSSDDDDQGPNAGPDEMDGEKELQKQAKAERAQKRKAKDALTSTAALRKRPRIDPTAPKAAAPKKPSKKKERVTWLPDVNNTSGRNSLRKQTIAHRATTIARLKESEAQSKINRAIREERDREKARDAPRALTQAERMEEAARTERRNAKSLNRWEAMEKKRNDEQAAKLAALKNRKLQGPVISWRSGSEHFRAPKYPPPVEPMPLPVEDGPKKRGRKTNAYHEQMARTREAQIHNGPGFNPIIMNSQSFQPPPWVGTDAQQPSPAVTPRSQNPGIPQTSIPAPTSQPTTLTAGQTDQQGLAEPVAALNQPTKQETTHTPLTTPAGPPQPSAEPADSAVPPQEPEANGVKNESFLSGIFDYANMEGENNGNVQNQLTNKTENPKEAEPASSVRSVDEQKMVSLEIATTQPSDNAEPALAPQIEAAPPETVYEERPAPAFVASDPTSLQTANEPPQTPAAGIESTSLATHSGPAPPIQVLPDVPSSTEQESPQQTTIPEPAPVEIPMEEGFMTKNFVTLKEFDELSGSQKQDFSFFFNTRKTPKPTRHNMALCPITLQPARYRDPSTGIGYANMHAYKVLQELKQHKFSWSSMLGCYVGRDGRAVARGAVEGFLSKPDAMLSGTS